MSRNHDIYLLQVIFHNKSILQSTTLINWIKNMTKRKGQHRYSQQMIIKIKLNYKTKEQHEVGMSDVESLDLLKSTPDGENKQNLKVISNK